MWRHLHRHPSSIWCIQTEQHNRVACGAVSVPDPSDSAVHRGPGGEGAAEGDPAGGGRDETDGGAAEVEGGRGGDGQVLHGGLYRHYLCLPHLPPPQSSHYVNIQYFSSLKFVKLI